MLAGSLRHPVHGSISTHPTPDGQLMCARLRIMRRLFDCGADLENVLADRKANLAARRTLLHQPSRMSSCCAKCCQADGLDRV